MGRPGAAVIATVADRSEQSACRTSAWRSHRQRGRRGETDEFSYNDVRDPVEVYDLNATVLHLLGIDHARLTFKFQGRDHCLTDVHGGWSRPSSPDEQPKGAGYGEFRSTRQGRSLLALGCLAPP
jgi:Protein of unknown function (DUF1501)